MRAALAVLALLLGGCIHTTVDDQETTVRTFGAATVVVAEDGSVTTESGGFSEGFVGFLATIPEAVLRLLGRGATCGAI